MGVDPVLQRFGRHAAIALARGDGGHAFAEPHGRRVAVPGVRLRHQLEHQRVSQLVGEKLAQRNLVQAAGRVELICPDTPRRAATDSRVD